MAVPIRRRNRARETGPIVKVELPSGTEALFKPHPYKVLYGGRGGGKSWAFAQTAIVRMLGSKVRILCCREIQDSIRQSVHQLLSDRISALELGSQFEITNSEIRCKRTGSLVTFHGLRHNIDSIKSLEGADIVWVEEGQNVPEESWVKLLPTIRKEGAEVWISMNPDLETDSSYQRWIANPPNKAWVCRLNWETNPWLTDTLRERQSEDKARYSPEMYAHVWDGAPLRLLEGTVYADELRSMQSDGRITDLTFDPALPVQVYADLGWSDMTSLVFLQPRGEHVRLLHAYQNRHKLWQHYLSYIQQRGWLIEFVALPFDASGSHQSKLISPVSIVELTRLAGFKTFVVPSVSVETGINALRNMFPKLWIDERQASDALAALRQYRFAIDDRGNYSRVPQHDEASHYADAMRYAAVHLGGGVRPVQNKQETVRRLGLRHAYAMHSHDWLGG